MSFHVKKQQQPHIEEVTDFKTKSVISKLIASWKKISILRRTIYIICK
jgi:hypothetical protein